MTPGNPQILTCPFCGEKKEIIMLNYLYLVKGID